MDFITHVLVPETNANMKRASDTPSTAKELTVTEFMKWLGCWFLISLHPGRDRRDHWSLDQKEGEISLLLGRYGISKHRFELIRQHISVCTQQTATVTHDAVMDEFKELLTAIHLNMREVFTPGTTVIVDESMVTWMNRYSIPNWKVVTRKPHLFGQEWHDIADGRCSIIFGLELAAKQRPIADNQEFKSKMAAVVLRLCEITGLFGSGRIVCADSAFGGIRVE